MDIRVLRAGFEQELTKIAADVSEGKDEVLKDIAKKFPALVKKEPEEKSASVVGAAKELGTKALKHLEKHEAIHEVAGLGALAVPSIDTLQAKLRARLAGDKSEHGAEKRKLMGEGAHAATEIGGLGYLAAPVVAKRLLHGKWGH